MFHMVNSALKAQSVWDKTWRTPWRIIMGSKSNFVSILKAGHQDLERITVGSVKKITAPNPLSSFGSPVLYTLLLTDYKSDPYCTLSTMLCIACAGFGCCMIVPGLGQNPAYAMAYLWRTLWLTYGLPLILERYLHNFGI